MGHETGTEEKNEAEYRLTESSVPLNEVEKLIFRRRNVRAYKKKQIPENIVRRILDAGRFAPSSGNTQPWKFIVLQDNDLIEEMTADHAKACRMILQLLDFLAPSETRRAWLLKLLQLINPSLFHSKVHALLKVIADGRLKLWHRAQTVIIIFIDKRAPGYPELDAGIAGQNMVLAAHSHGLRTCWVTFAGLLFFSRFTGAAKWNKRFNIKHPFKMISSICLGYPRGKVNGIANREKSTVDWYTGEGKLKKYRKNLGTGI